MSVKIVDEAVYGFLSAVGDDGKFEPGSEMSDRARVLIDLFLNNVPALLVARFLERHSGPELGRFLWEKSFPDDPQLENEAHRLSPSVRFCGRDDHALEFNTISSREVEALRSRLPGNKAFSEDRVRQIILDREMTVM